MASSLRAKLRRSGSCSFRSIADTWLSTVRVEMNSASAICAFVICRAIRERISASRTVTSAALAEPTVVTPSVSPVLPCRARVSQIRGGHGCATGPVRRTWSASESRRRRGQPQVRSEFMTTIDNAVRNGVDTATLFATLDAVGGDTDLAKFQFRATNRWLSGAHNQSTIHGFHAAKQEMTHRQPFTFDADHPPVLVGADNGPRPVEHPLRRPLAEGSSNVEGDIDLLGILGLSDQVRNGYQQIRVSFKLRGDDPEKLRTVVEQSRRRSAVFDVITHSVPVTFEATP